MVVILLMAGRGDNRSNLLKILPDEADIRISDFIFTEVGKENMRWEVKARSAEYQKKLNLALLDQVRIKLTTPDGRIFILTGDEGKMQTETKDVELNGHVVMISDAGDKFSTDYLRYSDAEKRIYTDAPVRLENENMHIEGVGLSILVNKGQVTLASNVRAKINH